MIWHGPFGPIVQRPLPAPQRRFAAAARKKLGTNPPVWIYRSKNVREPVLEWFVWRKEHTGIWKEFRPLREHPIWEKYVAPPTEYPNG